MSDKVREARMARLSALVDSPELSASDQAAVAWAIALLSQGAEERREAVNADELADVGVAYEKWSATAPIATNWQHEMAFKAGWCAAPPSTPTAAVAQQCSARDEQGALCDYVAGHVGACHFGGWPDAIAFASPAQEAEGSAERALPEASKAEPVAFLPHEWLELLRSDPNAAAVACASRSAHWDTPLYAHPPAEDAARHDDDIAAEAADAILRNLCGRKGIGDELESYDDDVLSEIVKMIEGSIRAALSQLGKQEG